MNRCPVCSQVFRFEGVQTVIVTRTGKKPTWRHWDACDHCSVWYVHDENGMPLFHTKEEPRKGLFVAA